MKNEAKIKLLLNCIYGSKASKRKEIQEMSKFNMGDIVRIKPEIKFDHKVSRTGIIKDITYSTDGNTYFINHDNSCIMSGWKEDALELVASFAGYEKFTKHNLKEGMIVQYRNGERALFIADNFVSKFGFMKLSSYDDSLLVRRSTICDSSGYDIHKVYTAKSDEMLSIDYIFDIHRIDLLWERKEEPAHKEMTVEEIEKALGHPVKIVGEGTDV